MQVKITSLETIKTGIGKTGKPWTLVKASFEGKTPSYSGFVYENVPTAGQTIEVELSQEEYNGRMQDKFKIITPKAAQAGISEMAIKTELHRVFQALDRKINLIMDKLEIRDFKSEVEAVRNQEPMEPNFDGLNPDEIPF